MPVTKLMSGGQKGSSGPGIPEPAEFSVPSHILSYEVNEEALRQGDSEAFDRFWELESQRLYQLALRITGCREDALDTIQSTFEKFFRGLNRLDPKRPVRPWFYTILTRTAVDLVRSRAGQEENRKLAQMFADPSFGSDSHSIDGAEEKMGLVHRALEELSALDRAIVLLRTERCLTHAEIAECLDLTTKAVRNRYSRTCQTLREIISFRLHSQNHPGFNSRKDRS